MCLGVGVAIPKEETRKRHMGSIRRAARTEPVCCTSLSLYIYICSSLSLCAYIYMSVLALSQREGFNSNAGVCVCAAKKSGVLYRYILSPDVVSSAMWHVATHVIEYIYSRYI